MKKLMWGFVLCVLIFSGAWADTAPKFSGWKQAETEHFTFVYEAASKEAAEAYAKIADEAWNKVAEVYSLPQDKITVYVTGRTNTINAYTYFAPLSIGMFTTPFVIPDFTYRDDWVKYVFTHELIHAANASFEGRENVAASIFGSFFRNIDIQSINGWELEGLTTVLETELSDAGRGRSPYFELMYKAPAMEGCLLSYDEIGLEEEPPSGQIYVYGYLMMRSLADRWGMNTLADIERNRPLFGNLEDSVLEVTGQKAQDIWRDVKIALTKRYAQERSIPEGKIISPRDSSYYKPAVILEDGTIIALRNSGSSTDVVLLNPALASGEAAFDLLKGADSEVKETVLFSAGVPDEYSVTADGSGKVYAVLPLQRGDRAPGLETEYQIFSWDKENGLKQLTEGSSFFQPSVSRDGSTLVALEQKGLHMRLVRVDTATGEVTPLLEDENYDFAMPSVSADGSRIALIRVGGGRGAIATLDMNKAAGISPALNASVLTVVANGDGLITDPSYPSWNADGTLTYCSNDRGRLEVYEVRQNEAGSFVSAPVVSDPVGALWTWKTDRGIYYGSYAGSGYVIKMKPSSEWGAIPDWNGPSMPGEKVCIGALEDDYVAFEPYENADKISVPARDKAQWVNSETIKEPVTVLQNERRYINLPEKLIALPLLNILSLPDGTTSFGFGYLDAGMSSQLMGRMNLVVADFIFYPKIMNFSAEAGISCEINNSALDVFVTRSLATENSEFSENNMLMAGFTTPFYLRSTPVSYIDVSTITTLSGGIVRRNASAFACNEDATSKIALSGAAGLSISGEKWNASRSKGVVYNSSAVALVNWENTLNTMYCGAEADVDMLFGDGDSYSGFYLQGRYLDAPAALTVANSTMKHGGSRVGLENPANFIGQFKLVSDLGGAYLNLYEEALCSLSKTGTFSLDDILATGLELSVPLGHDTLAAGITGNYSLNAQKFSVGEVYCTIKLNFIRL